LLGADNGAVEETAGLAAERPGAPEPLERPPKRHNDIAAALGGIGTFGGAITFAALLVSNGACTGDNVPILLGHVSFVFLGSLLAVILASYRIGHIIYVGPYPKTPIY